MDIFADTTSFFEEIEEGIEVYDLAGVKIGKVKHIQLPSHSHNPSLADFPYDLGNKNIPSEMAYRLLRSGFICVNAGLLARDRLVTPTEIAVIFDGTVRLNVKKNDLMTI